MQIVHRMLAAAIGWEAAPPSLSDEAALTLIAKGLNERHQAAKEAERASVALYSLVYFSADGTAGRLPRPDETGADDETDETGGGGGTRRDAASLVGGAPVIEEGYATTVKQGGLGVLVPRYGIEGWVFPYASNGQAPFTFTEAGELCAKAEGCVIRPLDKVSVRLSVDRMRLQPQLSMELIDPESGRNLCDVLVERRASAKRSRAEEARRERKLARAEKEELADERGEGPAAMAARLRGG